MRDNFNKQTLSKTMSQTDLITGRIQGVISQPYAFTHDIYIDEALEYPADWRNELHTIRTAQMNDVINIRLNCPGGSDTVMGAFCKAIAESQAKIIGHIEHMCCSAATIIFLACDEFVVSDDCEFMIHTAGVGYSGKQNNFHEYALFVNKGNERLMKKYYNGFLSESEIEQALKGTDFWFDADEVVERLSARAKKFDEDSGTMTYEKALGMSKEDIIAYIWPDEASEEQGEVTQNVIDVDEDMQDVPPYEIDFENLIVYTDDNAYCFGFDSICEDNFSSEDFLEELGMEGKQDWIDVAQALGVEYKSKESAKKLAKRCQKKMIEILEDNEVADE